MPGALIADDVRRPFGLLTPPRETPSGGNFRETVAIHRTDEVGFLI
jgi:hypothetical protein